MSDSSSYDLKIIDKLTAQPCVDETIYDLYFEDSSTRFFANGFLVSSNTPEVTVRKVAAILRGLSRPQLTAALQKLPELRETFERFGSRTVLQSMQLQLLDPSFEAQDMNPQLVDNSKAFLQNSLFGLSRAWTLREINKPSLPEAKISLPELQVLDNVVCIDNEYCSRATIKASFLAWSRLTTNDEWEHGYCKFSRELFEGTGVLFYSNDPHATDVDQSRLRRFEATVKALPSFETPISLSKSAAAKHEKIPALAIATSHLQLNAEAVEATVVLPPRNFDVKERIKVTCVPPSFVL